jgi:hypothetical protein
MSVLPRYTAAASSWIAWSEVMLTLKPRSSKAWEHLLPRCSIVRANLRNVVESASNFKRVASCGNGIPHTMEKPSTPLASSTFSGLPLASRVLPHLSTIPFQILPWSVGHGNAVGEQGELFSFELSSQGASSEAPGLWSLEGIIASSTSRSSEAAEQVATLTFSGGSSPSKEAGSTNATNLT